jgi:hypothetical protein
MKLVVLHDFAASGRGQLMRAGTPAAMRGLGAFSQRVRLEGVLEGVLGLLVLVGDGLVVGDGDVILLLGFLNRSSRLCSMVLVTLLKYTTWFLSSRYACQPGGRSGSEEGNLLAVVIHGRELLLDGSSSSSSSG